ncbi:hypothetical protein [Amycolatopsis sp. EV170708-02-1]|uniref:hypothetical protein n=1 Tax=Amycolatopsis sp. EV170708-02-1 TaxID=2919322 RepID=UPI001F0C6443|nr:hypothetical protein [Amycolatopsis sp. EV170708-02-1]UMP04690.1 hypothetical protein MJQ72_07570 [Amycolatopsis sp. EV170708-02-1]
MKEHDSATGNRAESLLDVPALRADTPGSEKVVHFNNAGCGLLAKPVLAAMLDHLNLEAEIGGYEAAAARSDQVAGFYREIAALINARPRNIAFAASATHAYSTALSSIRFEPGDVVLTTRNDSSPTRSRSCRCGSGSASRSCTHRTPGKAVSTSRPWRP